MCRMILCSSGFNAYKCYETALSVMISYQMPEINHCIKVLRTMPTTFERNKNITNDSPYKIFNCKNCVMTIGPVFICFCEALGQIFCGFPSLPLERGGGGLGARLAGFCWRWGGCAALLSYWRRCGPLAMNGSLWLSLHIRSQWLAGCRRYCVLSGQLTGADWAPCGNTTPLHIWGV